jgi:hypothetical protein
MQGWQKNVTDSYAQWDAMSSTIVQDMISGSVAKIAELDELFTAAVVVRNNATGARPLQPHQFAVPKNDITYSFCSPSPIAGSTFVRAQCPGVHSIYGNSATADYDRIGAKCCSARSCCGDEEEGGCD